MYFTEFFSDKPEKISYCVAIPAESEGEYVIKTSALKAISLFHHGAYENIPDASTYAKENNLKLTNVFRNLYLEGPPQHKDKSKFITQLIAIIE